MKMFSFNKFNESESSRRFLTQETIEDSFYEMIDDGYQINHFKKSYISKEDLKNRSYNGMSEIPREGYVTYYSVTISKKHTDDNIVDLLKSHGKDLILFAQTSSRVAKMMDGKIKQITQNLTDGKSMFSLYIYTEELESKTDSTMADLADDIKKIVSNSNLIWGFSRDGKVIIEENSIIVDVPNCHVNKMNSFIKGLELKFNKEKSQWTSTYWDRLKYEGKVKAEATKIANRGGGNYGYQLKVTPISK